MADIDKFVLDNTVSILVLNGAIAITVDGEKIDFDNTVAILVLNGA